MASSSRSVERSVRIYRALIKVYPASFRDEYGDEMIHVFRDLATDAWLRRRRVGLLALWFRVIADLVRTVPKQHLSRCRTDEGGDAMTFRSLFTRRLTSDEADQRWSQVAVFGGAILFLPLIARKFLSMDLTRPQLFFGLLLTVALTLQMLGFALLLSWVGRKDRPKFYLTLGQLVIFTISVLAMIFGVWMLTTMAITEYELILGLLLAGDVTMAGCFVGATLPILQEARLQRREKHDACP
jgi:hypothetical protein